MVSYFKDNIMDPGFPMHMLIYDLHNSRDTKYCLGRRQTCNGYTKTLYYINLQASFLHLHDKSINITVSQGFYIVLYSQKGVTSKRERVQNTLVTEALP